MKKEIPKWFLKETTVSHDGVVDEAYSGYELQKEGITLCKFAKESLGELKEFFAKIELEKLK
jgi:hypothetical protein